MAQVNYPIGRDELKRIIDDFIKNEIGHPFFHGVSDDTVEHIYHEGNIQAENKVYPIDPK